MSGFNYKSRSARTHVDGLAHIHEGAKAFQIHQTSNRKPSSSNSKLPEKVLNVILALILIFSMVPLFNSSFNNQKAGAAGAVNFGNVSINEGARVALAGNKSITALESTTGGSVQALADQTGGLNVANENIDSSVNSFISTNYKTDPLQASLSNAKLLSIADVQNKKYLMPSTDREWWLSDTGAQAPFSWRGYAKTDNTLANNSLTVSGELEGMKYDNHLLDNGAFCFTSSHQLHSWTSEGQKKAFLSTRSICKKHKKHCFIGPRRIQTFKSD